MSGSASYNYTGPVTRHEASTAVMVDKKAYEILVSTYDIYQRYIKMLEDKIAQYEKELEKK